MSIAGKAAVSHDYEAKNGNLLKSTYANGWEVTYTYDNLDRVTEVKASKDGTSYTIGRYIYDKLGRVARFVDGQVSGKSCTYGYDLTDRLCEAVFDDGTAYRYTYDANDCLVKEVQTTPDGVRTVTRGYDADSRETSVACGSAKIEKTFDKLGRLSSIRRNGGKHTTTYIYETAADGGPTGRVKTVKNGGSTWDYTYDASGNVSGVTESGLWGVHSYTYDAQGQLIREYDPGKKQFIRYQYDIGGNLTEVRSYPVSESGVPEGDGTVEKQFAYNDAWKDQLTAVTMDGRTRNFTYDANGNLLSDGNYTYSWTKGSQLQKVTGSGLEATYTYDASGIRTSKTVNGVTTEYLTAGGSILSEKKNGIWQHYLYDGSGQLMAIRYKGADYYYLRDGLMTITGLVDANGTAVVNYRYDSWGMLTGISGSMAETLGKDNPYRFKGYYYDEETGMYYLKSRYYQPEICRFISADSTEVITGTPAELMNKNLYLYCDNDPIMKVDEEGQIAGWLVSAALGAAVNVAASFIIAQAMGQDFGVEDVAVAALTGALGGFFGGMSGIVKGYGGILLKKYGSAIANGIFTGTVMYRSGASLEASLIGGGVSALLSASGIGDLADLTLVNEGRIVTGNVVATGAIDLVVNTGYNGISSAVSTAMTSSSNRKSKTSSSKKYKTKNAYMMSMKPRKVSEKVERRRNHIYRVLKYTYRGRLYTRWNKIR